MIEKNELNFVIVSNYKLYNLMWLKFFYKRIKNKNIF